MTLAHRLSTAIEQSGLTLHEIADGAGMSVGGLSLLRSGQVADPRLSTLVGLAAVLKVDFAWLATGQLAGKVPMSKGEHAAVLKRLDKLTPAGRQALVNWMDALEV